MLEKILTHTKAMIEEKDEPVPTLNAAFTFLSDDSPLDSLDLATLIVTLEEETGLDPFRDGFVEFRTIGELAALYDKASN